MLDACAGVPLAMTYKEESEGIRMDKRDDLDEIVSLVARIEARVLALVGAIVGGAGLFLMTAWLVVKGGPQVGVHLQLLSYYFYGYSVTWSGSFVGFFYGALVGAAAGWLIGMTYNAIAHLRR